MQKIRVKVHVARVALIHHNTMLVWGRELERE